jgi:hypothetical protein
MLKRCDTCDQPLTAPQTIHDYATEKSFVDRQLHPLKSRTQKQTSSEKAEPEVELFDPIRDDNTTRQTQAPKVLKPRKPKAITASFQVPSIMKVMDRVTVVVRCGNQECGRDFVAPIGGLQQKIESKKQDGWAMSMSAEGRCLFFCESHHQKTLADIEFEGEDF